MSLRYFTVVISLLIIILHTVDSFFLGDVININASQSITCQISQDGTTANGFQACAVRAYFGTNGTEEVTVNVYNGLRYVNIFNQFILKRCPDSIGRWVGNVGFATCGQAQSYELFGSMQLCICATNNCNEKLQTCIASAETTTSIQLSDVIPSLNMTIQCQDTLNASNICREHVFIDVSRCEEFVKNNSALCAITTRGTQTTQTSLLYDNYAAYLDQKIYEIKSAFNRGVVLGNNETSTNLYYRYTNDPLANVEECVCTAYSQCNQDINTCTSPLAAVVETSIPTSASITITNPNETSQSTSITSASANLSGTSESTSITPTTTNPVGTSAESTSMIAATTNLITSMNNSTTNVVGTSESTSMIAATTNLITSIDNSTINVVGTSESTPMATSMSILTSDSTITTVSSSSTTPAPSPIVTTSTSQSGIQRELDSGRGATAGIVCGIIFTAAIVTAEVIFFKFCSAGVAAQGSAYAV